MGAIPNEVLLQILSYVSKKDLKAARLTRVPQLYSCASSLLFTTAYVAARRGVLDAFKNLTTHPEFCQYVKEVIFDSSWISPASVAEHADDESGPALARLFEEQENIQANELQISLENAFKCLSKVTKVSYADLSRVSCLPGDRDDPAWGGQYSEGPLIRRLENLGPVEFSSCCIRLEPNAGCLRHDDKFLYRRMFGGLVSLLQVLSDHASTQLEQLSLGDRTHSSKYGGIPFWFLWQQLLPTSARTIHSFASIFYNLRKFELSVSMLEQSEMIWLHLEWHAGNLANVLCFAENLEELKLAGSLISFMKISVKSTFATHTWSRLHTICLENFTASARELEDFLKRHSHSLRNMTLDKFDLWSGSWIEFETIIPATSPRLNFILGSVSQRRLSVSAHALLPLSCKDLDVSGPKHDRYADAERVEDEEGTEEEGTYNSSSSEELEYCSDDSSSEIRESRRNPRN